MAEFQKPQRSAEAEAKRHLKLLERRMHHLEGRINALPEPARQDGRVLSFDRSEAAALRWAINQLGRMWNYGTQSNPAR